MSETMKVTLSKDTLMKKLPKVKLVTLVNEFLPMDESDRPSYFKKSELADKLQGTQVNLHALFATLVDNDVRVHTIKELAPGFSEEIDKMAASKEHGEIDFDKLVRIREEHLEEYGNKSDVRGLINPEIDEDFVLKPATLKLFVHLLTRGEEGYTPENVLLKGPQGCGKTETAQQFAAHAGLPLLKLNCALVREPRDWFGYKTAENGNVHWVKSEFCKLLERGGGVILLDEISRAAPPILNSLMPLLDGTGKTFLEEVKEVVRRGPDIYFFATANLGSQFTGTYGKLDSALNDRFAIRVEVDYLEAEKEIELLKKRTGIQDKDAKKLVSVAAKVRAAASGSLGSTLSDTISTRNLLDAATLYQTLGQDAFEYTILPLFSAQGGANSQQAQVLQIIQSQFGA